MKRSLSRRSLNSVVVAVRTGARSLLAETGTRLGLEIALQNIMFHFSLEAAVSADMVLVVRRKVTSAAKAPACLE